MTVVQKTLLLGTSERIGRGGFAPFELAHPSLGFVPSPPVCDPRNVGLPNTHLQRTNAATDPGIGASRRRGTVAFAAEVQSR